MCIRDRFIDPVKQNYIFKNDVDGLNVQTGTTKITVTTHLEHVEIKIEGVSVAWLYIL